MAADMETRLADHDRRLGRVEEKHGYLDQLITEVRQARETMTETVKRLQEVIGDHGALKESKGHFRDQVKDLWGAIRGIDDRVRTVEQNQSGTAANVQHVGREAAEGSEFRRQLLGRLIVALVTAALSIAGTAMFMSGP